MLILTRRPNESIFIGGPEITVTILQIHGQQVRIGISAPDNVSIHREEIYDKIQAEEKAKLAAEAASKRRNKPTR